MLKVRQVIIATTGADGVAAGSGSISLAEFGGEATIVKLYLNYGATAPATTDVAITDDAGDAILTRTDTATDGAFYLGRQLCDVDGAAIAAGYQAGVPVRGSINVAVAQSNALDPCVAVTAYLKV